MLAPINHIVPIAMVRRTRLLARPGEVLALAGQAVKPTDVIATAVVKPVHYMLDVTRGLGVSAEKAARLIERREGDKVVQGDIIATRSGLSKRTIRVPRPGRIVLISEGQVLIQADTAPYRLLAGYPGVVAELVPNRGAIIETTGALIRALWGNGKLGTGVLTNLAAEPDHILTSDQVNVSVRGGVLLGGHCNQAKALRNAGEHRIRGLILGSLAPELAGIAIRMPYPIVVLEGFGMLPMNSAAFKLLTTNDKRDVTVNAEPFDRASGNKPEVLIPLPGSENLDMPPDMDMLIPGMRVRITRAPYRGQVATIEDIPPGNTVFPNGLRAPGATLTLEDRKSVQIPLANLEILQ